jgi:hypothetical protein
MIFESDGNIQGGVDHTFIAALGDATTNAPVIPSAGYLTLELRMDLYPAEISTQLRLYSEEASTSRQAKQEGAIVFFRPPGYYADNVNEVVMERIAIPLTTPGATFSFSFIIADRYGDGLCCASKGELDTGYTIYEGNPSSGSLIVQSKFEQSGREVKVFNVHGDATDGTGAETPELTNPSVEVKVTINLDVYPDETGFYIEDARRRRVVDVPPGTYSEQSGIVTEIVTLENGLYTFTILDVFGDGLNGDGGFYKLEVVSGVVSGGSQPPLLSGTGAFASRESQTFLLEGDAAQYPLSIYIPTGMKPQDFSFSVYRLDLIETDALIASKVRGFYQNANEEVREHFEITEGGLYRIVFEDIGDGVQGEIRVVPGSVDPSVFNSTAFSISPEDTENSQRSHVKFFAGVSPSLSETSGKNLTLRVKFDRFPGEIEWILLANQDVPLPPASPSQVKREVVAFSPQTKYNPDLENTWYEETIIIPNLTGNNSFTLIVSDSGKDGLCCSFGDGGPIEVYDGDPKEGILLFSDPFHDDDRISADFYVLGSASSEVACNWLVGLVILSISVTFIVR